MYIYYNPIIRYPHSLAHTIRGTLGMVTEPYVKYMDMSARVRVRVLARPTR